ncbi:TetR/AcrR family transcriptional regulator [Streptomyces sp. NPDC091272]|uniref:TetR/AcrR family transcriptional regulator n=1 Tax=Streptomyces sp. NPDC091272 TaxID=3365981 RepID=UPI00382F1EBC
MDSAPASPPPSPAERADSRRKRLRLLKAARQIVAAKGLEAGAHEIATLAEVGVGTLYRRFGTREALIQDIVAAAVAELRAAVDHALDTPDPWEGLALFLTELTRAQTLNRGICELAAQTTSLEPERSASRLWLREAAQQLTERAQRAGVLRGDVTWRDIVVLTRASVSTDCLDLRAADTQWQRTVALLLDGLRAPGTRPLPGEAPHDLLADANTPG